MFRFATPEYFYLLLILPLLWGVHLLSARARRRAIERELAREEGGCSAVWRDASPAIRRVDRQMFEGFSREELDLLAAFQRRMLSGLRRGDGPRCPRGGGAG